MIQFLKALFAPLAAVLCRIKRPGLAKLHYNKRVEHLALLQYGRAGSIQKFGTDSLRVLWPFPPKRQPAKIDPVPRAIGGGTTRE